MPSSRVAINEDACPVGDDLLGTLYRTHEHGLAALVETVSPDVRAMLALFCYRRSHLHSLSLAIAATCDKRDLMEQGGIAGETLFAASREAPAGPVAGQSGRRGITLSTAPLSTVPPMMDVDDETEQLSA
ncbi:MAG: hypothetical protein K2W78_08280 [Xanthobacteraceae bacterium]|nr:hypothetical protein [Xanthobacteraceae bacterium]